MTAGRVREPGLWLAATLACVGLLAASGAWLTVRYRPDRQTSVPGTPIIQVPRHGGGWVGDVHHVMALAFYAALAGFVIALVLRRPSPWSVAPVAGAVAATLVAASTGSALVWRQLALRAVRVNTDYAGVWRAAYDSTVRFVLTDRELTQPHYRQLLTAHLFAAPAVIVVALLAAAAYVRTLRR